ncbi:hypothetical protein AJ80_07193 [Polytolypa hystricis UAMH7299]|uniref:Carboxylic ester hydrolase n=1 Tax=Polytolypa hystricis (strain UAMH7299) TaxID=1447883 RepID=A0A2B7XRB0_POLH7|nr:hypothetical protein AJ80_07193 [Polytolypa hystricis UAMH7299]
MVSSMFSTSFAAVISVLATAANAASLVAVPDFGSNPTGLEMNIYVPDTPAANPAVILALHGCLGNGPGYAQMTRYNELADQHGFITIFPSSKNDSNCWDVASASSLARDGQGDTTGLANMIAYTIQTHNADPAKIFVTGSSSGGMMTNVLSAMYPDIFSAASAYSGVAAGCLAGSPGSSPFSADPACADGQIIKSADQWVQQAKAMSPAGYDGAYPRFQTWHGTADSLVTYPNLGEQIKQWSGIHGVCFQRNNTDTPLSGYTQMTYGDGTAFVAYSAEGVGHVVPAQEDVDLKWFGLT